MATNGPQPRNGRWTLADPVNWPAAGRLTALAVVCMLCFLYGRAQDSNYKELVQLHYRADARAFAAADRTQQNHDLLLKLGAAITDLGRRLDTLSKRFGGPDEQPPDKTPERGGE